MNKRKMQALIIAALISVNTLTPLAEERNTTEIEYNVSSVVKSVENQLYISNLEYMKGSETEYGEIKKDTTHAGKSITLIVDGEVKEFEKGMGAHATSTLIYDISNYKNDYTRLVTYAGIDSRQGGNGNGARFEVFTSVDGQDWKLAADLGVLKGCDEAGYIDIELGDANFIKLYADNNGGNGNDHAVWADTKLVKDDYSLSGTPITGLETIQTYDSNLKGNSIEYNLENNEMTILKRALVNRIGYESIQRIAASDPIYNEGINYLMNDYNALRYFILGGPINIGGSYQKSLKAFCEIYAANKDSIKDPADDNFNLRLATSIALSYARKETTSPWIKSNDSTNAVARYNVFQKLVSSGRMDKGGDTDDHRKWSTAEFKALPVTMMRWSVDARLRDDEILWMADYALKMKESGKDQFDAYNYIEYKSGYNYANPIYYDEANREKFNNKYNFEDYYSNYGDTNIERMWMVFEEGSVCGGLAQTYSVLSDIFGRPSSPLGQPGHAASLTYLWNKDNQRYEWVIQNDVSGWTQSGNQFDDRMLGWGDQWKTWSDWNNASYTVLASDAVMYDYENYEKAALLNLLAESYADDNDTKREIYEKALDYQSINLNSIEGLINCYKADNSVTSDEYFKLAQRIINTYNYYPQAMMELLGLIEGNITDMNLVAQLDVLKNNALIRSANATPDVCTNVSMNKQLANKYLNENQSSELATFSFDGENANKIVLNSKYDGSSIRVKYSIDGGSTWTESNDHIIALSDKELKNITAKNDIKIGLVGASEVHTIDILDGKSISASTVYANDNENLLLGDVENLEFSLDGGTTWCDYIIKEGDSINPNNVDGIRIEGNHNVKVRYKSYGRYLQSEEVEYKFTENTDTDDRKYIQLKYVDLEDFTSQQSTSNDHAAKNLIDGSANTAWHTAYKYEANKFYTVRFDKERYITALEYLPGNGHNGRLRSGQILTSLDGENWEVSATFTDLADDTTLKNLKLDIPTKAKYVKLVATETWGNSIGERDKYFSGKMLNFYEDTTIINDEPVVLPDDVPVDTTDTPVTLPDDVPVEDQIETPEEDLDTDMNVKPEPEVPDESFDSNMEVIPDEEQAGNDEDIDIPDNKDDEDIIKDIEVEEESEGIHNLKINTTEGLNKLLEWLSSNISYTRDETILTDIETNIKTFRINVRNSDNLVSYINVKVDGNNKDLVNLLTLIDIETPTVEEIPDDTEVEISNDVSTESEGSSSEKTPDKEISKVDNTNIEVDSPLYEVVSQETSVQEETEYKEEDVDNLTNQTDSIDIKEDNTDNDIKENNLSKDDKEEVAADYSNINTEKTLKKDTVVIGSSLLLIALIIVILKFKEKNKK